MLIDKNLEQEKFISSIYENLKNNNVEYELDEQIIPKSIAWKRATESIMKDINDKVGRLLCFAKYREIVPFFLACR